MKIFLALFLGCLVAVGVYALEVTSTGGVYPTVTALSGVVIPAGTAALPSLSFSGDANNGIYAPAADQIGLSVAGALEVTVDAIGILPNLPAAETIASAATITADACGALKRVTAGGAVTTNTTNTFTAPAAGNTGCCMWVTNTGANNITLDQNANFKASGGADVVLAQFTSVHVCQIGTYWEQMDALLTPS